MTRGIVRSAFRNWLSGVVSALAMYLVLGTWAQAQQCSSGPDVCRETAPGGALLHNPNSKGNLGWTVTDSATLQGVPKADYESRGSTPGPPLSPVYVPERLHGCMTWNRCGSPFVQFFDFSLLPGTVSPD